MVKKFAFRLMLVAASILVLVGVPNSGPAGTGLGEVAQADQEELGYHGLYIDAGGECYASSGVEEAIDHMFSHCNMLQLVALILAFIAAVVILGAFIISLMPAATAGSAAFASWVVAGFTAGGLTMAVVGAILGIVSWVCNSYWGTLEDFCEPVSGYGPS